MNIPKHTTVAALGWGSSLGLSWEQFCWQHWPCPQGHSPLHQDSTWLLAGGLHVLHLAFGESLNNLFRSESHFANIESKLERACRVELGFQGPRRWTWGLSVVLVTHQRLHHPKHSHELDFSAKAMPQFSCVDAFISMTNWSMWSVYKNSTEFYKGTEPLKWF